MAAVLEIEPLGGNSVEIEYTTEECSLLLDEAVNSLQKINKLIESVHGATTLSKKMWALAMPEAQKCFFCRYRPGCGPYLEYRSQQLSSEWPADVIGYLIEMKLLNNGRLLLTVATAVGNLYARGVTDSTERHPALEYLATGDHIAIFNLFRTPAADTFSESAQTIIYRYV